MKKIRWYHASPTRFRIGTILSGQVADHNSVWINSNIVPHYTILEKAVAENWHIYEVDPYGKLTYGWMWDEATCSRATILRYVGSARGISQNQKVAKTWLKDSKWLPPEYAVTQQQVGNFNRKRKARS